MSGRNCFKRIDRQKSNNNFEKNMMRVPVHLLRTSPPERQNGDTERKRKVKVERQLSKLPAPPPRNSACTPVNSPGKCQSSQGPQRVRHGGVWSWEWRSARPSSRWLWGRTRWRWLPGTLPAIYRVVGFDELPLSRQLWWCTMRRLLPGTSPEIYISLDSQIYCSESYMSSFRQSIKGKYTLAVSWQ